jgi:hypothetical protein
MIKARTAMEKIGIKIKSGKIIAGYLVFRRTLSPERLKMEICVVVVMVSPPPLTCVVRSSPEMIPSIEVKFIASGISCV